MSSLFHTLLFHRTLGKFHYKQEGNYCVGTVGYEDVDCDFIDLTYVYIGLLLSNILNLKNVINVCFLFFFLTSNRFVAAQVKYRKLFIKRLQHLVSVCVRESVKLKVRLDLATFH